MKNYLQTVQDDASVKHPLNRRHLAKWVAGLASPNLGLIRVKTILMTFIYLCAAAIKIHATLIMGTFNNGTLYVASDSCMTYQNGSYIQQFKIEKLFKVSDFCCVSICNNYGGYVSTPQKTNSTLYLLPNELNRLCTGIPPGITDQSKIATINAQFAMVYANYLANRLSTDSNNLETRLTYWGYDRFENRFFIYSYLFDSSTGTNSPAKVVALNRGHENTGSPLTLTAEVGFLSALIVPILTNPADPPDDKLAPLRTQAFRQEVKQVFEEVPMKPDQVIQFMLELFELHKNHAKHFDYDKGWIDEPYVFFVVTPNGIVSTSFVHRPAQQAAVPLRMVLSVMHHSD
jgi:hypothetical protein